MFVGSNPSQQSPAWIHRPIVLFHLTLGQILLSTNFCPPPPPPNVTFSLRGIEAAQSKKPLRDHFVRQNNDFTKGYTSHIMPLGMLRKEPPKRGVYGPYLGLI